MRSYSKVSPTFWLGTTGRELRRLGTNHQLVALYLMTCPASNMAGLYYLPLPLVSHETSLDQESVKAIIAKLASLGFCDYDADSEVVWVREMVRYQVGERLTKKDHRCKALVVEIDRYATSPLHRGYVARYGRTYHLGDHYEVEIRGDEAPGAPLPKGDNAVSSPPWKPLGSPLEAPSKGSATVEKPLESPSEGRKCTTSEPFEAPRKPLRSQEQEQEQKQEQEQEQKQEDLHVRTSSAPKTAHAEGPGLPEQALNLADELRRLIADRLPGYKLISDERWPKTREQWANTFRLAHEQDKRSWDELRETLEWSQADEFWQANILSAATLRKQYDKLRAQMARGTSARSAANDIRFGYAPPSEASDFAVEGDLW